MPRQVPEWVGRSDDTPPPPRVKERILRRYGGRCARTGHVFAPGDEIEFDHVIPLALDGENRESNLQPLLGAAHKEKTREDVRAKSKASRGFKRHFGLAGGPQRKIPGSKGTGVRKGVDGTVRFINEERKWT